MAPTITLVGGGSTHWTPTLLVDFANSKSLADAEVRLVDVDRSNLDTMVRLGEHIAERRGIGLTVTAADSLEDGLEGAAFVLTTLSVGGFRSMTADIEIPYRFGLRQPVGDSIGPGGIFRSLRSVPVMVEIAQAVKKVAPEALVVNVSNPLTALTRAMIKETGISAVGLCNELVGMEFVLSLLFDVGFGDLRPVVGGVNHLPLLTSLEIGGEDGFGKLSDLLANPGSRATEPIWMDPPEAMHWRKPEGTSWTKGAVIANCRLKFELFQRFGYLPGSADTHIAEFFSWFVTERSDFGRDWGVHHYGIAGHSDDKTRDNTAFDELLEATEIPGWPSGELVATLLDGIVSGVAQDLPMNLPNTGQVANLPEGVLVECIGVANGDGVAPRDVTRIDGALGIQLERIVASQELTIEAAIDGDRRKLFEAMLTDPVVGSLPYEDVATLTDDLLAATAPWLPRFS